jgi:hypothetical protein
MPTVTMIGKTVAIAMAAETAIPRDGDVIEAGIGVTERKMPMVTS